MADGFEEFDAAVEGLRQRLMEIGVPPRQAEQAAVELAQDQTPTNMRQRPDGALEIDIGAPRRMPAPTRMQPPDNSGVTAGEFGLPPMPDFGRNALAGEISASPEPSAADKIARMMLGDERASPERRRLVEGITGSSGMGRTRLGLMDVGLNQAYGAPRNALEGNYPEAVMDAAQFVAPVAGKVATKGIDAFSRLPSVVQGGIIAAPFLATPTTADGPNAVPVGQSVAPNQDELNQLIEQRKILQTQTEQARLQREKMRPHGMRVPTDKSDPLFMKADREFERLNGQLADLDKQISTARRRGDPVYLRELQIAEEQRQADLKAKRAQTPTRELMSDYTPYIPAVTYPAALIGGAALKARGMQAINSELKDISTRWGAAVERAQTAQPGSRAYEMAAAEARGLKNEFANRLAAGENGTRHAVEFGAGIGLMGGFLPEEVDFARAVSGSPLWGDLKKNILDQPGTTAERAALAAGFGGVTSHLGAQGTKMFMGRPNPTSFGSATDALPQTPTPRAGPPAPQSPTAVSPAGAYPIPPEASAPPPATRQPSQPGQSSDLPPGLARDKNGVVYDVHTGQKVNKRYLTPKDGEKPTPRQSRPEPKPDRSEVPEKTPVQIDDMRPMGSRSRGED